MSCISGPCWVRPLKAHFPQMAKNLLLYVLYVLLCMLPCCLAENSGRNPPKIVTKGGNLVLQAGEGGNIVFEPGQGKQVLVGGNALNVSGGAGAKGEKGDQGLQGPPGKTGDTGKSGQNGTKGDKGEAGPPGQAVSVNGTVNVTGPPGPKGEPGLTGPQGAPGNTGQNGTDGSQGPPGVKGTKGELGAQGPPGPLFNTLNQSTLRCENSSDYGSVRFMSGFLQVCTELGWRKLAYQDSLCQLNIPKVNHEAFQTATFGILLQFNGNLNVNLSPMMNFTNITTEYQQKGGRNTTQYVQSLMGQAVYIKGQEYINLHGIPVDFWSGDDWSVMGLMRFHDDGILGVEKELPVLGDGEASTNKGFHLGLKKQKLLYGFFSNDIQPVSTVEYNRWYHVAWSWEKINNKRTIFLEGSIVKQDSSQTSYQGIGGKTQIGAWWSKDIKSNLEIDTLYIVNKAVDYKRNQQQCLAKAFNSYMP